MARGYTKEDIRARIISLLDSSELGMSGVDISHSLGMSRTTAAKYLRLLAADGTLRYRDAGNITLWMLARGRESFVFPDDYFKAASFYADHLKNASDADAVMLVENCMRSGASAVRMILEVVLPASEAVHDMYDAGTIGTAEQNLMSCVIERSLFLIENIGAPPLADDAQSVIISASDSRCALLSRITAAIYRTNGWSVYDVGDISDTAGVMFDLDFQRLADKVWRNKQGLLVTVAFSHTSEGLNFFADSLYPITKTSKNMRLVLCEYDLKDVPADMSRSCDYYTDNVKHIIQWSQTASEKMRTH